MRWRVQIVQMCGGKIYFVEHVADAFPTVAAGADGRPWLKLYTVGGESYEFACDSIRAIGICPSAV